MRRESGIDDDDDAEEEVEDEEDEALEVVRVLGAEELAVLISIVSCRSIADEVARCSRWSLMGKVVV